MTLFSLSSGEPRPWPEINFSFFPNKASLPQPILLPPVSFMRSRVTWAHFHHKGDPTNTLSLSIGWEALSFLSQGILQLNFRSFG